MEKMLWYYFEYWYCYHYLMDTILSYYDDYQSEFVWAIAIAFVCDVCS